LHSARSAANEGWDDDLPDISSDVMLKSEGADDDAELRGRLLAAEAELDAARQSLGAKEHEVATLRAELERAAGEVWGGHGVVSVKRVAVWASLVPNVQGMCLFVVSAIGLQGKAMSISIITVCVVNISGTLRSNP
jgi:hypothetical protein